MNIFLHSQYLNFGIVYTFFMHSSLILQPNPVQIRIDLIYFQLINKFEYNRQRNDLKLFYTNKTESSSIIFAVI